MMLLMVLIRLTASAPPRAAALPGARTSVTLGVSFTITGTSLNSIAHLVISSQTFGSWPTALPIPRSHIPWGHPKFNSSPSAPASRLRSMISFHSFFDSTIRLTTTAWSG